MSIQLAKSYKLSSRVKNKLNYFKYLDSASLACQKWNRTNDSKYPLVFHPYLNHYSHPFIKERMYGELAPLRWCNYDDASIAHFLQFPDDISKPYFVEPNDHILTLAHFLGGKTPSDYIKLVDDVKELINSNNFKGVILADDSLQQQFIHYFGEDLIHKVFKYEQMRCIPKISDEKFMDTENKLKETVNFLFLASDYYIKGVDLLLQAWLSLDSQKSAKLIIACPNVPAKVLDYYKKINSVQFINQAPLSKTQKVFLLSNSDVTIALTHIDGGPHAWEGIEYGHPIITNTSHRDKYLLKNDNGFSITFKNQYYKLGEYGIRYNSFDEYLSMVDEDVKSGLYNSSVKELAGVISQYIDNPHLLREHSIRSLQLAWDQSIWKSNSTLLSLYSNAIRS
jgi:hypothetical protein